MTKEEKSLLLTDLCARLPYGVKCNAVLKQIDGSLKSVFGKFKGYNGWANIGDNLVDIKTVKPYLRPMSSMTKEEDEWLNDRINFSRDDEVDKLRQKWGIVMLEIYNNSGRYVFSNFTEILDWLNAHHFDYRGLIEKGLAFEAPENMYK